MATSTVSKMAARLVQLIKLEIDNAPARPAPTKRPEGVRVATATDEKAIFDLLMLLAEENAMDPVNDYRVLAMIKKATDRQGGMIGIIDAPDGSIAACVGLILSQWWYTESWHTEEVWSFVHPDHRGGSADHAAKLIEFSKWWGDQLGMPVIMGVLSTKRTLGKVRLYARSIPLVGAIFLHRGGSV